MLSVLSFPPPPSPPSELARINLCQSCEKDFPASSPAAANPISGTQYKRGKLRIHPRKKSKTNVYGFLKDALTGLSPPLLEPPGSVAAVLPDVLERFPCRWTVKDSEDLCSWRLRTTLWDKLLVKLLKKFLKHIIK